MTKRWPTVQLYKTTLVTMLLLLPQAAAAGSPPLNNAAVLKMVKAGISPTAIVHLIEQSTTAFDLSPDSLIALRKQGIPSIVIDAMVLAASASAQPAHSANSPSDASIPLPDHFGVFVVDGTRLIELRSTPVTTVVGIEVAPGHGVGMDGLRGDPPLTITSGEPMFYIYQANVDINTITFRKLDYRNEFQAIQFNILGTGAQFFSSIYHISPTAVVKVGLWQPRPPRPIEISPIDGKPDLYRIKLGKSLTPGNYALYWSGAMHDADVAFTLVGTTRGAAYYFARELPPPQ